MANEQNLVPNEKRTPNERRRNAQKAGKASGAARRERKLLRDELLALLSDGDTQSKMCLALIRQAQRGNIKAFEVVRDTIGEKVDRAIPTDAENNLFEAITGSAEEDVTTDEIPELEQAPAAGDDLVEPPEV